MLWFFEREDARLHYEVRRKSDGDEFELVITASDGRQRIEQFRDACDVEARSRSFRNGFARKGGVRPQQWAEDGRRSTMRSEQCATNNEGSLQG